jgi:hypothetical protein
LDRNRYRAIPAYKSSDPRNLSSKGHTNDNPFTAHCAKPLYHRNTGAWPTEGRNGHRCHGATTPGDGVRRGNKRPLVFAVCLTERKCNRWKCSLRCPEARTDASNHTWPSAPLSSWSVRRGLKPVPSCTRPGKNPESRPGIHDILQVVLPNNQPIVNALWGPYVI